MLELVQVEEQQREFGVAAVGGGYRVLEVLDQRAAVDQVGQGITGRQFMRPLLGLLAFGDFLFQLTVDAFQVLQALHAQVLVQPRQLFGLLSQLDILLGHLHKHRHLRLQDLRDDGGKQIVGRTFLIRLQPVQFVSEMGGDENDGHRRRARMRVDGLGRFKAVHAGHADVEQNHGKLMQQHLA